MTAHYWSNGHRQLLLKDGRLNGTLPSTLGAVPALTLMDLTNNTLTGTLPPSIAGLWLLK
jgi:hypothetical protein